MNTTPQEKLSAGLYLIALADETILSTKYVDKAIKELKLIKHARKNMPF